MTKTIKELLDEYSECDYNKNNPILDLEKVEARQEEILSQVEALVRKQTVEEILEIPYIKAGGAWTKEEFISYKKTL